MFRGIWSAHGIPLNLLLCTLTHHQKSSIFNIIQLWIFLECQPWRLKCAAPKRRSKYTTIFSLFNFLGNISRNWRCNSKTFTTTKTFGRADGKIGSGTANSETDRRQGHKARQNLASQTFKKPDKNIGGWVWQKSGCCRTSNQPGTDITWIQRWSVFLFCDFMSNY